MKLRYRVTGGCAVFGHEPGSEFEADLSDFDHRRLTRSHLTVVEITDPVQPPDGGPVTNRKKEE